MSKMHLFTSESVSEGHPDKMADQISDAILDAILQRDSGCRVACETMTNTGLILLAGELKTDVQLPYKEIARDVVRRIGYTSSEMGFDAESCAVIDTLGEQSGDISQGVDRDEPEDQGAGDQGLMFGYATRETPEYMPAPIALSHRLVRRQSELRRAGTLPWLRPDAKSQVTLRYTDGKPAAVDTCVVSTQHTPDIPDEDIYQGVMEEIIEPVIPAEWIGSETKHLINPTGRFVVGGPLGDCGLTGRKIIVDTYGGMARHGGGCFSGKDPSKVDRSAAYAGRYVAKNVVAAGLAERCEIQLSYAIGVAEPTSVAVETFGTGMIEEERIVELVRAHFDLRPYGIIKALDLARPIYTATAAYGHFGREDVDLPWERTDKAEALRDAANMRSAVEA